MDDDDVAGLYADCHALLLRLAGRVPDGLVSRARGWLAVGELEEFTAAVVHAVTAGRVALWEGDLELLAELLEATGSPTSRLDPVEVLDGDADPEPLHVFAPVPPEWFDRANGDIPRTLDATAPDQADWGPADAIDEAAITATAAELGALGLWRSWRAAADDSPWPPPRRVFLVECVEDEPAHQLAVRLQRALATVGETDPQIEVHTAAEPLPAYQRAALSDATLLWAAAPPTEITLAPVFDRVDPRLGPLFTPDHPRVGDDERTWLLEYLTAGLPLLATTTQMDDILDPSAPAAVPMNFRTDGHWIWTDTVEYYIDHHHIAPAPDLLAHIRAQGYEPPEVTPISLFRTHAFLRRPTDRKAIWRPGQPTPATPTS